MITCRNELFEQLALGAVVLTPNLRLTKVLSESYDAEQTNEVWAAPYIYPFNHWLDSLWQTYSARNQKGHIVLLNELQSNLIWLDLIKENTPELYNFEALAKKVKQAFGHCLSWNIDTSLETFNKNEETIFFKNIIEIYKSSTLGQISQAELLNKIIMLITNEGSVKLPNTLILAYFDDFSPAQEKLWALINSQTSTKLLYFDERKVPLSINRVEAKTAQDELLHVVNWIKEQLADPFKKIGVVVPDLQQSRDQLETFLLKHFKKENFNISMGKSLDQFSIINNALSLLTLPEKVISLEVIHLLCHSSFVGKSTKEGFLRTQIFQKLKASTEKTFYVKEVLKAFKGTYLAEGLLALLKGLNASKTQTLAQWSECFIMALEAIGFPGEQVLSSYEYQIHLRFMQALLDYAQLSDETKLLSKQEATHLLDWQLKQIIFQPQAHDSSVQFIGYLESLGLQFDALWVMDLNEFQLPQKLNPSAFIPIEIQRENQMPHANEERELRLSTKQIQRLSASADNIIFSHHINTDQGECLPSFLIAEYPLLYLKEPLSNLSDSDVCLESFEGCMDVLVSNIEHTKGGSYLIKEQAQCPFRAFSKFRLKLPEERENIEGLDSLDRGILIHQVMELFWREVKSQSQLLLLEEKNTLSPILFSVIDNALQSLKKKKPYTFNKLFYELEKKRLYKIVTKYLELEKMRPPFKVIHIEFESIFKINELNIKLRVDRIDELDNGDWLVIDYKTGSPTLSSMFEERISEPQLPIYVLTENRIKAVLYAQLQQRNVKNKGFSQNEIDIQGVKLIEKQQKITWDEQCEKWKQSVAFLSQEFLSGVIQPTPLSEMLCTSCSYFGLCGIYREH